MKRSAVYLAIAVTLASIAIGRLSQPAAAAAPAFPEKSKSIDLIVPSTAGGSADLVARLLGPGMERELGIPVRVVNRVGAGNQVGVSELARSKKDGYTFGITNLPHTPLLYLNPDRKADFNRKSFQPLANLTEDPHYVAVKADSPYKTMKELIDAAKANPEKIKIATLGIYGPEHLRIIQLQKLTGAKFANVNFDGIAASRTALLGGHIDVVFSTSAGLGGTIKSGHVRLLGVMDTQPTRFAPDVKTLKSMGYNIRSVLNLPVSLPAGTPREIVNILTSAAKKTVESEEFKQKAEAVGATPRYLNPEELGELWDEMEAELRTLLEMVKQP
jgi:tripartite-type tricarboxylate transporter receptor subunit TctC